MRLLSTSNTTSNVSHLINSVHEAENRNRHESVYNSVSRRSCSQRHVHGRRREYWPQRRNLWSRITWFNDCLSDLVSKNIFLVAKLRTGSWLLFDLESHHLFVHVSSLKLHLCIHANRPQAMRRHWASGMFWNICHFPLVVAFTCASRALEVFVEGKEVEQPIRWYGSMPPPFILSRETGIGVAASV